MFKLKNRRDSFFNEEENKNYDKDQRRVILDNSKELLVVAGAGSGKTYTISGKIKYLIERCHYHEDEILCLSFTNEAVNNLKERIKYPVKVLTFHKLALEILYDRFLNYHIASDTLINYIVSEYFLIDDEETKTLLLEYFEGMNYEEIINSKQLLILKNNLLTLIKTIKCNNIPLVKIAKIRNYLLTSQDKIFFTFALKIYSLYENELFSEEKIDFDDMITLASQIVKRRGIRKKYRYIIIDEYQDISKIRFELILAIKKYLDCPLMCVGDDYQAIYGFSGSDVSLFLDFFKYFPNGRRIDIHNTYRNSYELIRISKRFIKKNPYQLKKNIKATFFYKNPIVLVYYDDYIKTYQDLFNYLYLDNAKNVLVLARYNKDLEIVKKLEHKGINTRYLTVHMAKGLEEDVVVLINFSNDYLGFPSKIEDNRIIAYMRNNNEEIPYAEERRLFYVALTRCRQRIYILAPKNNPSIFLKEIKGSVVKLLFQ